MEKKENIELTQALGKGMGKYGRKGAYENGTGSERIETNIK